MHENIACWDKKCRKNLRVSHVTTLSIYDDIVQNSCILPLLMILTKLLIKSIMWPFINDGLKLLLLSNCTISPQNSFAIHCCEGWWEKIGDWRIGRDLK